MINKKIIILATSILILAIITFRITYAYFSTEITGNGNYNIVTIGDLKIEYIDSEEITLNNALPGDSITKEIKVTNIGTIKTNYSLLFTKYNNTIENGELILNGNCTSLNTNNEIENTCENIEDTELLTISNITPIIKNNIELDVGITHKYILTFTFKDTGESQNYNKNKIFNAKIGVNEPLNEVTNDINISSNINGSNGKIEEVSFNINDLSDYNDDNIIYEVYRSESQNGDYILLERGKLQNKSENFSYTYNENATTLNSYYYKIIIYNKYMQKIGEKIDSYSYCFVAGTKVKTETGFKNIEDIKVGEKVYSYNLDNNSLELKKVLDTITSESIDTYIINVGNEEIEMTPKHELYIIDKGWVRAYNVKEGDKLYSSDNKLLEIEKITYKKYDKPIKTYNLTVEGNSNYFVSNFKLLVHNSAV